MSFAASSVVFLIGLRTGCPPVETRALQYLSLCLLSCTWISAELQQRETSKCPATKSGAPNCSLRTLSTVSRRPQSDPALYYILLSHGFRKRRGVRTTTPRSPAVPTWVLNGAGHGLPDSGGGERRTELRSPTHSFWRLHLRFLIASCRGCPGLGWSSGRGESQCLGGRDRPANYFRRLDQGRGPRYTVTGWREQRGEGEINRSAQGDNKGFLRLEA